MNSEWYEVEWRSIDFPFGRWKVEHRRFNTAAETARYIEDKKLITEAHRRIVRVTADGRREVVS